VERSEPQRGSTQGSPWADLNSGVGDGSGGSSNLSKRHTLLLDDGSDSRSRTGQWQRLLRDCCGEIDERAAALAAFAAFMALSLTSLHAVFPSFVRVRSMFHCTTCPAWPV
jgi:hypothetical protein